jgi:hypothetical protein
MEAPPGGFARGQVQRMMADRARDEWEATV